MHDDNQPNFQEATLRDLFAVHCLSPLIEDDLQSNNRKLYADQIAKNAYLIADAMMKEREV